MSTKTGPAEGRSGEEVATDWQAEQRRCFQQRVSHVRLGVLQADVVLTRVLQDVEDAGLRSYRNIDAALAADRLHHKVEAMRREMVDLKALAAYVQLETIGT